MAVPVAAYSSVPQIAEGMKQGLLPEYEVVHVSTDKESALKELPAVCAGELQPKALIFGGRVSEEDFEEISTAVSAKAPSVRIVRITRDDLVNAGVPVPPPGTPFPPAGPPPPGAPRPDPAVISKIIKDKLAGL